VRSAVVIAVNVNPEGGVPKHPVDSAFLRKEGVEGDRQNDLKHHGGPDRAVCLFSSEVIEELRSEGHPIEAGSVGENLTISGLDWNILQPGSQLNVGNALIEITSPAPPCRTIQNSFSKGNFSRISEKKHPGWSRWYARVLREAQVYTEDSVIVLGFKTK
tara:strand:- start:1584 stop:2063 length:480 start_codon:yes stop_codon:yes gene_type:complete